MEINVLIEHKHEGLETIDLEGLATFVLTEEGCPENTDVTITFVNNARIHELNRDYRGIDTPTDVLSFECDNDPFEDELEDVGLLAEALEYELGDVIIAPDIAAAQCIEFGTTFEEEVTLLTVHGLLHLCGYDHMEEEEALVMEALEDKLIAAWNQRTKA